MAKIQITIVVDHVDKWQEFKGCPDKQIVDETITALKDVLGYGERTSSAFFIASETTIEGEIIRT